MKADLFVDASIAVKFILNEVDSDSAYRLAASPLRLAAPDLVLLETANALWKNIRLGTATRAQADAGLIALHQIVPDLRPSGEWLTQAFALSIELDHPVYDCAYLALAIAADAPVVTADRRFLGVVSASPHASLVLSLSQALQRFGVD